MENLRLVMKNEGSWYVIESINFPELMDIFEDEYIPRANYSIKNEEAIYYIKSRSCIVIHFEKKIVYLNGVREFKVPPSWKLERDIEKVLDPEDWAWKKQKHKRGYTFVNFKDLDGKDCFIQESEDKDGTIYLGTHQHEMHLTKAMVEKLIPILKFKSLL